MSIPLEEARAQTGQEVGISRWFPIDQKVIDAFADATEDWQFIHIDPKAAEASPFGGTIAHGFLTLSLLSAMAYDALPEISGQEMAVNYGFDRIRFLSPVPSGARIRARFTQQGLEERRPGEITLTYNVTIEIEGAEKPALSAVWINRRYLEAAS